MTAGTTPLSVAIITRNEEENIGRCLASVAFADEVVVVDTHSSDRTVEIAKNMGARVVDHEWLGFGPQKQMAVDLCSHDWVLVLDADEEVPPETSDEIMAAIASPRADAYVFRRINFIGGRQIRFGSWRSDTVLRLFKKSMFAVTPRQVHEEIVGKGRVARFPRQAPILHHSFNCVADFILKAARYARPGAVQMAAAGRRGSISAAVLHSLWVFFFNYFLRLGFLDGRWGVVIAFSDMVGTFYKYAILWELEATGQISRKESPPRSS